MKQADVIVLAGQSNAVGVGRVEYLPHHFSPEKVAEYTAGYTDVPICYFSHDKHSGGFVKTGLNCTQLTENTFGPEVGIAEYFHQHPHDNDIFIVKCAFGGMALFRDFRSPSSGGGYDPDAYADQIPDIIPSIFAGVPVRDGWSYNELVKITKESLAWLEEQGYTPRIRAFCWMQGETDACDANNTKNYGWHYENLVADFTAAFGDYFEDCRFIDGGIGTRWPFYEEMNRAKAAYAAAHDHAVYIDTIDAGLTTVHEPTDEPDTAHYDSDSVIKLGHLFAEHSGL